MNIKFLKIISVIILCFGVTSCSEKEQAQSENSTKPAVAAVVDTTNVILAAVSQNGKWGYINSSFKEVIPLQFDGALRFNEGLACVRVADKWGFINIKGEFVIQPIYDDPGVFYDGLAKVGTVVSNGSSIKRYFYIDKTGKNVFEREFKFGEDFNNGVAMVNDENSKKLFLNLKGETITDGPPLLYNHWKYPKRPYGGEIKNVVEWDPKKGMPKEVTHDRDNYGYTDEFGNAATKQIYGEAGEFYYSFFTPKKYFSTNPKDTANVNSISGTSKQNYTIAEIEATYKSAESFESEDGERTTLTFITSDKKEIVFDAYNSENKLISLLFICPDCKGPDKTIKPMVGKKYNLKFTLQIIEAEGGGTIELRTLEGVDN